MTKGAAMVWAGEELPAWPSAAREGGAGTTGIESMFP